MFPYKFLQGLKLWEGNMAAFLGNLRNVVIASFVLAILLVGVYCGTQGFDGMPLIGSSSPAISMSSQAYYGSACSIISISCRSPPCPRCPPS